MKLINLILTCLFIAWVLTQVKPLFRTDNDREAEKIFLKCQLEKVDIKTCEKITGVE